MQRGRPDFHEESLKEQAESIHEEARMVLPGVQALFGFQLVAAFDGRFAILALREQAIHFSALILVAFVVGLLMTPAAYHRLCEQTAVSAYFTTMSSRLIAAAMVPLALAIALDIYIVGEMIFTGLPWPLAAGFATAVFIVLCSMWIAFPIAHRRSSRGRT